MVHIVLRPATAALATLFVALSIAASAAAGPAPPAPKRLVVDSVSAPVLSVDQAAQVVEIVLVPDGEYQPVHPDSLDPADGDSSPALNDAGSDQSDEN